MKFRLTPLNIGTAFFIVIAVYVWIYGAGVVTGQQYQRWTNIIGGLFLFFAFVVAFLDITFRNFFKDTKTLWIVELSFITLTTIIFLIVK
ncbi:hypothetical protein EOD41_01500 [Mucilaginibacter limnophilus]|uniref:Uncharacterized protein n=1 Tax=Mucilaginibacter limnophilus TaxID=1932778 RepID=A0A3S2UR78_9SPHI|nr:hypothetical protein [Mucilaginibacter limnophilus]RVU02643.1 hypothetical protein EOD41_01500 [Mucilaginibacter limnophilus]